MGTSNKCSLIGALAVCIVLCACALTPEVERVVDGLRKEQAAVAQNIEILRGQLDKEGLSDGDRAYIEERVAAFEAGLADLQAREEAATDAGEGAAAFGLGADAAQILAYILTAVGAGAASPFLLALRRASKEKQQALLAEALSKKVGGSAS